MAAKDAQRDEGRRTGRGFLVITGAKGWFFVSAAVLNFGLPKLFSSQAEYGAYGIVINAVSLLNMVVIAGTIQAVAKLVSERPEATRAVARRATVLQLGVGFPLAAAYFALAGPIAEALKDPSYAPLLRISALIVAGYSFYAIYVGCFNGRKAFTRQAGLDIIFATLRTAGILGAVALGFGVAGAIWAFAGGALVITALAWVWLRRWLRQHDGAGGEFMEVGGRRLLAFLVSTMVYTFVLNAVMRIDLFALKRFSAAALLPLGERASDASNALAGAYTLMLNVARLPYQAVIAIAFVIFPLLSKSTFDNDRAATKVYVQGTMRYALMLIGLFASVLAAAGADVVRPLYPEYAYASEALLLLCIAYAFFALLYIATTVLIAAGRPWLATIITTGTALALAGFCALLIPSAAAGPAMLTAAAQSLLIATGLGLAVAAGVVLKLYEAFLPAKSAIRLGLIIATILLIGHFTAFDQIIEIHDPVPSFTAEGLGQTTKSMLGSRLLWAAAGVGKACAFGVLYILLLLVLGEIGPEDRARVKRVVGGRKAIVRDTGSHGAAHDAASSSQAEHAPPPSDKDAAPEGEA